MNPGKHRQAKWGLRCLAIVLLLATQVLPAAPGGRSEAKQAALGPGSVAVVPFVFIGRVNEDLTRAFLERLVSLKISSIIVDDASLTSHLPAGVNSRSDASLEALLTAAKAANAEVLILGQASNYKFLDASGISLRVRVISVDTGIELHRTLANETAWTLSAAMQQAAGAAAKQIVKRWRDERQ